MARGVLFRRLCRDAIERFYSRQGLGLADKGLRMHGEFAGLRRLKTFAQGLGARLFSSASDLRERIARDEGDSEALRQHGFARQRRMSMPRRRRSCPLNSRAV